MENSLADARARGLAAAESAADHADRTHIDWSARALELFCEYASLMPGKKFLVEDAREFATQAGLEQPPEPRAWGHIVKQAQRMGWVESAGFAPARTSNGSPKVVWRCAEEKHG